MRGDFEAHAADIPEEIEVVEPFAGRFELRGKSLRTHAARGVLINAAFQIGLSSLGLLKRVGIAAFLTASEFGVWGLLVTTLITLTGLKQLGIADKYIQQSESDQVAAFQKFFTLSFAFTLLFCAIVAVALPVYIVLIYGRPEILGPGFVLSLSLLASAFTSPLLIPYRKMQFVRQRALTSVDPVVSTVVMIGLAAAGMSYWSLILGTLAGSVAIAIVAVVTCPYPIRFRYEPGTLREYYDFSWPLFVNGLVALLRVQGAVLVGSWTVGLAGIGAIGLAGQFAAYVTRVEGIIAQTMYPAVCAVADRTAVLFETFIKSNRIGLMWGLPFGIGLFLFGPDLVDHVLGERWSIVEPLLQTFGLILAARQIAFNWTLYMRAVGRTKPIAIESFIGFGIFVTVTAPLMFLLGLDGYVIGVSVDVAVSLVVRTYFMSKLFEGFKMLRHMWRAAAPCVPAVAAVLLARFVESGERTFGIAIAELGIFVAVVALSTWLFERELIGEAIAYLRGRPGPAAAQG